MTLFKGLHTLDSLFCVVSWMIHDDDLCCDSCSWVPFVQPLLFFRKILQLLYSLRNKGIKAVTGVLGTFSKGAQDQQGTALQQQGTHEQLSPHRKTVVDHPGNNTDY